MKKTQAFIAFLCLFGCATQKSELYVYPSGIVEVKKAEFVQYCEKGKALYKIHCAKCHTTVVNGKELIPDFTSVQLDAYSLRLGSVKHQAALTERNIPEEELELVLFFLGHKKPNVPIEGKKKGG